MNPGPQNTCSSAAYSMKLGVYSAIYEYYTNFYLNIYF